MNISIHTGSMHDDAVSRNREPFAQLEETLEKILGNLSQGCYRLYVRIRTIIKYFGRKHQIDLRE